MCAFPSDTADGSSLWMSTFGRTLTPSVGNQPARKLSNWLRAGAGRVRGLALALLCRGFIVLAERNIRLGHAERAVVVYEAATDVVRHVAGERQFELNVRAAEGRATACRLLGKYAEAARM